MLRMWLCNTALALVWITIGFGYGCQPDRMQRGSDIEEVFQTEIVCDASVVPHGAIEEHFNRWAVEATHRSGSTFTVWLAGDTRHTARRGLMILVPHVWGANVLGAQAAFLQTARARISRLDSLGPHEAMGPQGDALPVSERPQLGILSDGLPPTVWQAITGSSTTTHPRKCEPRHLAVLVDRSTSMPPHADGTTDLLRAFDNWLVEGRLCPGATFSAYSIGSSYDMVERIFTITVPAGTLGQRMAVLLGARHELSHVLPAVRGENASAIAEAVTVAVNELRERTGRGSLLIVSDMRQYTPGVWNFEQAVPSAEQFIAWLKRENLFVDLQDIPLTVCGLHNRRGPKAVVYSAGHDAAIRSVWEKAFQAMGAPQIQLFTTCGEGTFTPAAAVNQDGSSQ